MIVAKWAAAALKTQLFCLGVFNEHKCQLLALGFVLAAACAEGLCQTSLGCLLVDAKISLSLLAHAHCACLLMHIATI